MTTLEKFQLYCGMTCLGGSEQRNCKCSGPSQCELKNDPDFERYSRSATTGLIKAATEKGAKS